jgi:hypothetical protein
MLAGPGDHQNENSGNRGAGAALGRCASSSQDIMPACVAGTVKELHVPAAGARGSVDFDQGCDTVGRAR